MQDTFILWASGLTVVGCLITIIGLLGWLSVLVRLWRQWCERGYWQCWRCLNYFESQGRPRPLCLCNECLAEYLQEVA